MTATPDPNAILMAEGTSGITPAASDAERALLEWAEANPIPRPHLPMTKDGSRYAPTVYPDGTKGKATTRVTTFAGALDDGAGLLKWRHRILARGLLAIDTGGCDPDDTASVDRHIGTAFWHGGEKLAADIGTALHTAVEHAVTGSDARPPAPWDADVAAFVRMLATHGLTVAHAEATVYTPAGGGLCGTVDLFVRGPWGDDLRVLDLKTGSGADRLPYATQLACYAAATHRWDEGGWAPLPRIDWRKAYIAHLPAGSGECALIEVDLEAASRLIDLTSEVREVRRKATISALFAEVPAPEALPLDEVGEAEDTPAVTTSAEATDWIVERIKAVAKVEAAKAHLQRHWPDGVPTAPPFTDDHLLALDAVLVHLEATHGIDVELAPAGSVFVREVPTTFTLPAEPEQPPALWPIDDPGGPVDHDLADAIAHGFSQLDPQRLAWAMALGRQAKVGGRPWAVKAQALTPRLVAIQGAVLACVRTLWDADEPDFLTRGALAMVLDEDLQPGWPLGAVLGSLTIEQAQRLQELAVAFDDDHHTAGEVGAKALALAG